MDVQFYLPGNSQMYTQLCKSAPEWHCGQFCHCCRSHPFTQPPKFYALQCFSVDQTSLKSVHSHPLHVCFSPRVHTQQHLLTSSAIFAELTAVTNTQTDIQTCTGQPTCSTVWQCRLKIKLLQTCRVPSKDERHINIMLHMTLCFTDVRFIFDGLKILTKEKPSIRPLTVNIY